MKKRMLAVLLTAAMVLSLAACGGSAESTETAPETKAEETKTEEAKTEETAPAAEATGMDALIEAAKAEAEKIFGNVEIVELNGEIGFVAKGYTPARMTEKAAFAGKYIRILKYITLLN